MSHATAFIRRRKKNCVLFSITFAVSCNHFNVYLNHLRLNANVCTVFTTNVYSVKAITFRQLNSQAMICDKIIIIFVPIKTKQSFAAI